MRALITAYLVRLETSIEGTFGKIIVPGGFECFTAELPWRDNRSNVSCIPPGLYRCGIYKSRRFGTVFHLTDVNGRTYILIHTGNLAGDVHRV